MLIHPRTAPEEELLLDVREPVRRFLVRVLREPHLADDAASETMLTLIQRLRLRVRSSVWRRRNRRP